MKSKGIVLILDGLGDRPCPLLAGRTPLESAATPAMDALAERGQVGMMDPLLPGMPVDTHTGVGILFGVPPIEAVHLRRGPIEAAGTNGIQVRPGDVLLRANMAHIRNTPQTGRLDIIDRRAGRIDSNVDELCAALDGLDLGNGVSASLHAATHHRVVLQLRGQGLSAGISDTDPGGNHQHLGILTSAPLDATDPSARYTADALNRFTSLAHEILDAHPVNRERQEQGLPPANGVIARSAGIHQHFRSLLPYLGLKAAVIAGESTVIGLARLCNFTPVSSPSFTSTPETDVRKKLECAVNALTDHDIAFIHIKGTDTAAHDRNPQQKADLIGQIDRELQHMDLSSIVFAICADHSTDSVRGEHNGDPVPVLIHNPSGRIDTVSRFDEASCVSGGLGRLSAQEFLTSFLDATGALRNFTPQDLEYFQV